jgi:hydrogenase maturation protein HypF
MSTEADLPERTAMRVRVKGLVQGVGFRPFVWRLAREEGLSGHVLNDAEGVLAEVWGTPSKIDRFLERLRTDSPPLSRIDEVLAGAISEPAETPEEGFRIVSSVAGDVATGIVPDAATCPQCLEEVFAAADRRHRYAFTNCTHCGPRLSIIEAIPYDRAKTSMASFLMCSDCQAEYDDPADRRFHAQPNACPACGPKLWCEQDGKKIETQDPIRWAAERLAAGEIVAVKGIGGFHLAVDATRSDAIDRLRKRKNRPHKPLALMVRDVDQARTICEVSDAEENLLSDRAAPIVLMRSLEISGLADGLAPGQDELGVMLPYTPLHHLLMAEVRGPIVLTSGNLSEEPQVTDNEAAGTKLGGIADSFLMHDRAIVNRLDDSVVRVTSSGPAVLRRARGFAPAPLDLHEAFRAAPPVLAMGGELKSTFCLLRDGQAVLSQHIGDLENRPALEDFRKNLELYRRIYQFAPDVIAVDCHSDYLSTQVGLELAGELGAKLVQVQHHHAHLAAGLAEARVPPEGDRSLAIILDGSGLGPDGTIWGGEILCGGYAGFERLAHFAPVPLPGGTAAIREPWRNLVAHLRAAFGPSYALELSGSGIRERLAAKNTGVLDRMIDKGLNAPPSSSSGRLFDAVAAALGLCFDRQTFEGQTGMALETLARPFIRSETGYPVATTGATPLVLSWRPLWQALLADLESGVDCGRISARFHNGLINALVTTAADLAGKHKLTRIVLSGGVMQNALLADGLHAELSGRGFEVMLPRKVPVNDGGLALGQAAVAVVEAK